MGVQGRAPGWLYAAVLPYFKRCERYLGPPSAYRGSSGPVAFHQGHPDGPLDVAFLAAGEQAGYPSTDDVNGYQQDGFGCWDMNIDRGVRASSANAYPGCPPQGNVARWTGVLASTLLIEGHHVIGVELIRRREPIRI